MSGRRAAALVLLALALPLSGCVPGVQPPVDPPVDGGGSGPVDPGGDGAGMPIDASFFEYVDEQKAALDAWRDEWLASGCDAERTAAGDYGCAVSLTGAGYTAISLQILLGSTGVADFDRHPLLGDLAEVQDATEAAAVSSTAWTDSGCAGESDPECLTPTGLAIDDLMTLHTELSYWSR